METLRSAIKKLLQDVEQGWWKNGGSRKATIKTKCQTA